MPRLRESSGAEFIDQNCIILCTLKHTRLDMAVALGKRKRRVEVASEQGSVADMGAESKHEDLQDVFRRAFEAKFKPLRVQKREQEVPEVVGEDEQDINDEESDWSGISEPEDSILVVEHASIQRPDVALDKQALKAFMVSLQWPYLFGH